MSAVTIKALPGLMADELLDRLFIQESFFASVKYDLHMLHPMDTSWTLRGHLVDFCVLVAVNGSVAFSTSGILENFLGEKALPFALSLLS